VKKVLRNSFDSSKTLSEEKEFDIITDRWDKISKATSDDLQRSIGIKRIFHTEDGDIEVDFNCVN
jgi:hypothetical protein